MLATSLRPQAFHDRRPKQEYMSKMLCWLPFCTHKPSMIRAQRMKPCQKCFGGYNLAHTSISVIDARNNKLCQTCFEYEHAFSHVLAFSGDPPGPLGPTTSYSSYCKTHYFGSVAKVPGNILTRFSLLPWRIFLSLGAHWVPWGPGEGWSPMGPQILCVFCC